MTRMTHAQAMYDALVISLEADPRVNILGAGLFDVDLRKQLTDKLHKAYSDRFLMPPVSESAIMAIGVGAAMAGDRPLIGVSTASFAYEAWQQLVNEAGPAHYMSGGQISVPITVFMQHGMRGAGAAQHSHSPQSSLWNSPGIEIALPSGPRDMKGLIRTAIQSDNPTVILDHAKLFAIEEDVPDGDFAIPFGKADIKRVGSDVTVVATSYAVHAALEAAQTLAKDGISVEVVDPRTIVPLDKQAILNSVGKTGRLVIADEGHISCGVASEIAAIVAEEGFGLLKGPIRRVARPDVSSAYSPPLEDHVRPSAPRIIAAIRGLLG